MGSCFAGFTATACQCRPDPRGTVTISPSDPLEAPRIQANYLSEEIDRKVVAGGTAVVDAELRVNGVSHLRVIDAPFIPRTTSVNINAPTLMIGEKGAFLVINT